MEPRLANMRLRTSTRPWPSTCWHWCVLAAATFGSSCAMLHTETPLEHANDVLPKCAHVAPDLATFVLSKDAMGSVEPALSHRPSGNDYVMLLHGAAIHLFSAPGATQEGVQLALECHEAHVALGEGAPPNDPYVLPGKWADIDVSSDGDGFKVVVSGPSFDDSKLLLDHARVYRTATALRSTAQ